MPSIKHRLSFKAKKTDKNKALVTTRSTKSFKVKADLVVNHQPTTLTDRNSSSDDDVSPLTIRNNISDVASPRNHLDDVQRIHHTKKSPPPITNTTETSTDNSGAPATTSAAAATAATTTSQTHPPSTADAAKRYIRGGGYSRQHYFSYEERWSQENVDRVIASWKMTEQQRTKLLDLQSRVRDVGDYFLNDPHQLVYCIKDEVGNVELAEKLFRKVVQLRQSSPHEIDTLLTEHELPDDYDYFPMAVLKGVDKEGDPILVCRTGMADCWGLYKRHGREAMIRHAIYNQELSARGAWVDDFEEEHKRKPRQFICIFDLQGLSARHMRPGLLPVLGHVSRVLQDTYPEIDKRLLIIRAPSIFKMIWGLIKHFFEPELRELMVFGTSDEDSQHVMEQYIDPNVLPKCIHPAGTDGPLARGFEHVIMEGGMIPPEGEYKTPEHAKRKAMESAASASTAASIRQDRKDYSSAVQTQGKTLLVGSFDLVPHSTSPPCDNTYPDDDDDQQLSPILAQEYKTLVHIDKNTTCNSALLN